MRENKELFKENIKKTFKGGYLFGNDFPLFKSKNINITQTIFYYLFISEII